MILELGGPHEARPTVLAVPNTHNSHIKLENFVKNATLIISGPCPMINDETSEVKLK